MLRTGQIEAGFELLDLIARRTTDEELRSQCLYNQGEVLKQLDQPEEAYRVWYPPAHKPPEKRNHFDLLSRLRVMRAFEEYALRLPPPDFPPRVQIEVTNRCNLRCVMCTRNQMTRSLGDVSLETVRKIADECSHEPGTIICLYFLGEPLLHRGLEEIVAHLDSVKDNSPVRLLYGIQTNGMLLTEDRARSLLKAGLRNFAFSIDGLEGDLERIRPGASYPVVERNVLHLLELGEQMGIDDLSVDITKLCDDLDADEVKRFLERWQGKVSNVYLNGINKVEGNSYLAVDGTIKPVAAKTGKPKPVYCNHGQRLLVYWNGDYGFCCGDLDGGLKLGNAKDLSVRQAWNSVAINRIRKKIINADYEGLPVCKNCPHSRA